MIRTIIHTRALHWQKKKLRKSISDNINFQQTNIDAQLNEREDYETRDDDSMTHLIQNENTGKKRKSSISTAWPGSISHDMRETCSYSST